MITCYEVDDRTGTQALTGTAGTTGGWVLRYTNTAMALLLTGGTTISYTEGPPRFGVNISADTHLAGSIRGTRNGIPVVLRATSPTYIPVTGTPSTTLGRAAGATANALTGGKILWQARLERDASDAEMVAWTATINQLDRYRPPQDLIDAINAQNLISGSSWLWEAYTDYDPSQPTSVTGIGTGPIWTNNGAPAKTILEVEIEHFINLPDWHYNVLDVLTTSQTAETTYRRGNSYREYKFQSNATRFVVKLIADWAGGFFASIGVRQDNTPLAPLTPDGNYMWRRMDVVGLSGTHTYRIIDGMQSILPSITASFYNGTAVKGVTSALIQAPKSATFSVIAPTPAVNTLVVIGDSFEGQNSAVTPTTEAPSMRIRDDYPGNVIVFAFKSASHWHYTSQTGSVQINQFVADLNLAFAGATSKRILDCLSPNDQGAFTSFWASRAQLRTQMGALYDAINVSLPVATMHLRTALLRTAVYEGSTVSDIVGPGTGSGTAVGGVILQDVRDDFGTVQSTRSAFLALLNGIPIFPNFGPSVNVDPSDNFHPSPTGELTIKTAEKAYLAAAADSVGGGY